MQVAYDYSQNIASSERRLEVRHIAVILIAKLATAKSELICRVRNISEGGAKLEIALKLEVGQHVRLELRSDLWMGGCIVWANNGMAGVQFDSKIDVEHFLSRTESRIDRIRARAPRFRCSAAGIMVTVNGAFTCRVSNIALAGACLTSIPIGHSPRVGQVLRIMVEGIPARHAIAMWVADGSVGIKFRHPLSYNELEEWLIDNVPSSAWVPLHTVTN